MLPMHLNAERVHHDYNHHRRHSALGYQPPARYAAAIGTHR